MTWQLLFYPKLAYGWLSDMVLNRARYSFSLPPGKVLVVTPVINVADADLLALGATQINYNDGQNQAGTPFGQKAVMAGSNYIKAAVGDQQRGIASMTPQETDTASTLAVYGGAGQGNVGYKIFTSQTGESTLLPDGTPNPANIWCYDYRSPKTLEIRKGIARKTRLLNGEMYDEYDGHNYFEPHIAGNGENFFAPHLASDQAAFSFLSTTLIGAHSQTYWRDAEYLWRGGIIQTYWVSGLANPTRFVFSRLLAFHMDIMAKRHVNTNSPTIGFSFPMGTDFASFGITYQRPVPGGGVMQGSHQPRFSPTMGILVNFFGLMMGNGTFGWQTTERFGQDPAVLVPDQLPRVGYFGSGNPVRIAPKNGARAEQVQAAGYPSHPCGYNDHPLVAGYLYGKGYEWTGGVATWTYGAVKRANNTTPALNWNTYPLDQHNAQAGICFVMGTGNKRAVYFYTCHRSAGQWAQETVTIEGQELTFQAEGGGVLTCFLVTL